MKKLIVLALAGVLLPLAHAQATSRGGKYLFRVALRPQDRIEYRTREAGAKSPGEAYADLFVVKRLVGKVATVAHYQTIDQDGETLRWGEEETLHIDPQYLAPHPAEFPWRGYLAISFPGKAVGIGETWSLSRVYLGQFSTLSGAQKYTFTGFQHLKGKPMAVLKIEGEFMHGGGIGPGRFRVKMTAFVDVATGILERSEEETLSAGWNMESHKIVWQKTPDHKILQRVH